MKPKESNVYAYKQEPSLVRDDVRRAVTNKPRRIWEIGKKLGVIEVKPNAGRFGKHWYHWIYAKGRVPWANANFVECNIRALREDGVVVKLPHEYAKSESTYRRCRNHAHAQELQLEATEALLPKAKGQRRRALLQILNGLRPCCLDL